jgi:hypothetical protein
MNDIKLRVALYVLCLLLIGVSSILYPSRADVFARERYIRSRNRSIQSNDSSIRDEQTLDFVSIICFPRK